MSPSLSQENISRPKKGLIQFSLQLNAALIHLKTFCFIKVLQIYEKKLLLWLFVLPHLYWHCQMYLREGYISTS